jgi:hypothetical protein
MGLCHILTSLGCVVSAALFSYLEYIRGAFINTLITTEYVQYLRAVVLLDLQKRWNICEKMHIILFVICAGLVHFKCIISFLSVCNVFYGKHITTNFSSSIWLPCRLTCVTSIKLLSCDCSNSYYSELLKLRMLQLLKFVSVTILKVMYSWWILLSAILKMTHLNIVLHISL